MWQSEKKNLENRNLAQKKLFPKPYMYLYQNRKRQKICSDFWNRQSQPIVLITKLYRSKRYKLYFICYYYYFFFTDKASKLKKKIWFVKNNNSHYVLRILAASSIRFQPQWSHSSLLKHRNWFLPQWCPLDLATTASIASTQPRPSHPRLVSIFTVSIAQFKLTQIFELLHTALLEVSNSTKCIYRWIWLFSTRFDSTSCHCFFPFKWSS